MFETEVALDPDKKYFVIWERKRIGYFLKGEYFDRSGHPSGFIDEDDRLISTVLDGSGDPKGDLGSLDGDNGFVRNDGTRFSLICEDNLEQLRKTRSARGNRSCD